MSQRQSDSARFRQRKYWAQYGECPTCGAVPGLPCRGNFFNSGQSRMLWKAHTMRKKLTNDSE